MRLVEIPDTLGNYFIREDGKVFKAKGTKECKLYVQQYYKTAIKFSDEKFKNKFVHRLMATAFIPNPNNLSCVNHIDGNKLNNSLSNLEWITPELNSTHAKSIGLYKVGEEAGQSKYSEQVVREIRAFRKMFPRHSLGKVATIFKINYNTLLCIVYNKNWKHI